MTNLAPQFIPARLNLAILYAKIGKFAEARSQAEAVLDVSPSNAAAQKMLQQLSAVGS